MNEYLCQNCGHRGELTEHGKCQACGSGQVFYCSDSVPEPLTVRESYHNFA